MKSLLLLLLFALPLSAQEPAVTVAASSDGAVGVRERLNVSGPQGFTIRLFKESEAAFRHIVMSSPGEQAPNQIGISFTCPWSSCNTTLEALGGDALEGGEKYVIAFYDARQRPFQKDFTVEVEDAVGWVGSIGVPALMVLPFDAMGDISLGSGVQALVGYRPRTGGFLRNIRIGAGFHRLFLGDTAGETWAWSATIRLLGILEVGVGTTLNPGDGREPATVLFLGGQLVKLIGG